MRGLYIHIPFCSKICTYCDFTKRIPKDSKMIKDYLFRLKEELNSYKKYFSSIRTIYIGGGTPSLLELDDLKYLLDMLKDFKDIIEFDFEANPESLTREKAELLLKYGVNRISLGVQTFDDKLLKLIGRSHTKEDAINCVNMLKDVGFKSINIDLIFSIPTSNLSSIKNDLKEFYKLDINHLSYYSLIPEEKTILDYQIKNNLVSLLDNETEAKMYEFIISDLEKNGFIQYEISNFAKENYESIHNEIYWKNQEYIGIGLGASGYLDGVRYTNNTSLKAYNLEFKNSEEIIEKSEKLKEEMILGLRMTKGINIKEVNDKYNIDLLEKYKEIQKYLDSKDVEIVDGYLRITKKGLLIANDIFVIFI